MTYNFSDPNESRLQLKSGKQNGSFGAVFIDMWFIMLSGPFPKLPLRKIERIFLATCLFSNLIFIGTFQVLVTMNDSIDIKLESIEFIGILFDYTFGTIEIISAIWCCVILINRFESNFGLWFDVPTVEHFNLLFLSLLCNAWLQTFILYFVFRAHWKLHLRPWHISKTCRHWNNWIKVTFWSEQHLAHWERFLVRWKMYLVLKISVVPSLNHWKRNTFW